MSKKRLLFIEDLYDFYLNKYKRSTHFSSEKNGEPLVVQVHGKVNFDQSDKNKDGLLPVHLQSCHTDLNVNGSNINKTVMEAALPSFSNRPILGYIHKVITDENPDGQWEFYSHNMHEDENGEVVYDEYPIGIIPESCNAQLVYDEEKDKTYCEVDGYIFEEYSKAAEILEREGECFVSVELSIRELSYDAKSKYLNIEDFFFSGVTILGKTPQGETVKPGMSGSNIKLADFKAENNSLFENYESKMNELQERLNKLESTCFNIEEQTSALLLQKEGGNESKMNKFEELLEKYNKTVEDITFEYSDLSDEELEVKFKEVFEDGSNDDGEPGNNSSESEPSEGEGETSDDGKNNEGQEFEKLVRTYEISHEDVRYALYNLLASYEELDDDYYYISNVYDSYFVYEGWCTGKIYRQGYVKDGDNVSFDGERTELFRELLTASEKAKLEEMRSNYAELKAFKEEIELNELREKKKEILDSEKYEILAQKDEEGKFVNKDYEKLVSEMDNYSLTDLETEIKVLHSDYVSEHGNFALSKPEKKETTTKKQFVSVNKKAAKPSRYGKLFAKEEK
nr:MAG TPA: hypothetical protein [Caudoviricetes sp.]